MKDLLAWWFFPKRAKLFSSIIKIIIGLLIVLSFCTTLIGNVLDWIDAYVNPPQYLGISFLLLPITYSLVVKAVFWCVLFYLPYYIFGKRGEGTKRYLIPILLISMLISSFFATGVYTKPSNVEVTQTQLALLEARLGEINRMGEFYTLREFSTDITKLTKSTPDFFLTKEEGFSDLVVFYKECEDNWKEYYELIGSDKVRDNWRNNHVEEEAMLIFWGKYSKSVFTRNSAGGKEVGKLLDIWVRKYGITESMAPDADWTDLVPVYK